MKVAVHLRPQSPTANTRCMAIGEAFEAHGHEVIWGDRKTPVKGSDLVIQAVFNDTPCIRDAVEQEIPFIIMELPHFRGLHPNSQSGSFGYNGLAGGAWMPKPPSEERPKPSLRPLKDEGGTLIIGQKPTDHSLRGTDHGQWVVDRLAEFPEADFRPHPVMVPKGSLRPLREVMSGYGRLITFTSTSGVEGVVEGLSVRADHRGSLVRSVGDREEWLHKLSWAQGLHSEFSDLVPYILSGYEEARERVKAGLFELPREKVDRNAIYKRYSRLVEPALRAHRDRKI